MGTISRIANRVGTVVETNAWLARNALDIETFKAMKGRGATSGDIVINLRGIGEVGVRADSTDLATVWELFHRGEYVTKTPIRPKTVVDLGANVGTFLAFIAAQAGDSLEHYIGVEADAGSHRMLSNQVERMAVTARVDLFHAAVWEARGQVNFADSGPEWGRNVIADGGTVVDALTVTDVMDEAGMASCELMKMDIEGGESQVLPTIGAWAHRVEVLTVELHGQPDSWLADHVEGAGYVSVARGDFFRHHPAAVREDVVDKWLGDPGVIDLR